MRPMTEVPDSLIALATEFPADEVEDVAALLRDDPIAAARAWAEADPYLVEGVFERLEVFETAAIFPKGAAGAS